MQRILGIDPGSRFTGYGIIESDGVKSRHIFSGHIIVKGDDLPQKLGFIFAEVSALIKEWQPETMAVEQVFMSKNADSALKLGQARGAAICAGVNQGLDVGEYTPRAIKHAVVGSGSAAKEQIQEIMRLILKLEQKLQSDEADALAVALCHAHHNTPLGQLHKHLKKTGATW